MLSVSTFLHYGEVTPFKDKPRVIVVIDVLRATTTICTALASGAVGLVPVIDERTAYYTEKRLSSNDREVVFCGERRGYKIPGFHFGNSPTEFASVDLSGKILIHMTTNGTAAIKHLSGEDSLFTSSFVNLSATVGALTNQKSRINIACSGGGGTSCYEDTLCAGALAYEMRKSGNFDFDDTSLIAADLYDRNRGDIGAVMLKKSVHGRYLSSIGFGEDVMYSARLNLFDFSVKLKSGVLVKNEA